MQLDKIAFLIQYINGDVEDTSDDIIRDSVLYDYICRILEYMMERDICLQSSIGGIIDRFTTDYAEPFEGARNRLNSALEIIVVTYYATLMKHRADKLLECLE